MGEGPARVLVGQWNGDVSVRESMKKPVPLFSISRGIKCMAASDEVVAIGSVDGDMRIVRMDTALSENASTEGLHRMTSFAQWLVPRASRERMTRPISFDDPMAGGMRSYIPEWPVYPVHHVARVSRVRTERRVFF